jgi:N-acetylmuramic acid 6-phosphate etherase
MLDAREQAELFLAEAKDFQLGELLTEQPHPATSDLSELAKTDVAAGLLRLWSVDLSALERMSAALEPAAELAVSVAQCLHNGGRVFLAGCGATGRLSLALETLARQGMLPSAARESVVGFMAGGDAALIRSIEGFEDLPEYGRRQLDELAFTGRDLLIASTEGGETPWVIGVAEAAAECQPLLAPWFCYCNPDTLLRGTVERSRRVLDNPDIRKWNLAVGPMALAGSTRMQASTVLMLGIGLALLEGGRDGAVDAAQNAVAIRQRFERFQCGFAAFEVTRLAELTKREASDYGAGRRVWYQTRSFGLTVLTDTTERAPTFSLAPFENRLAPSDPRSLCYLTVPDAGNAAEAWQVLLGRQPRCLEWDACRTFTGRNWLDGYAIADALEPDPVLVSIEQVDDGLRIAYGNAAINFSNPFPDTTESSEHILFLNLLLKCMLNAHSTLVMGRLGRYEGNLMTYVKASNRKLIDRAIRYVRILAARDGGVVPTYAETAHALFETLATLKANEPVVIKTLDKLRTGGRICASR